MLGASFVLALRETHEVTGTYSQHPVVARGVDLRHMDLREPREVARLMADVRPDLVIHAAAMTNVDLAEREPAHAAAVNVEGSAHVARAVAHADAALVVISTDAVFDGTGGPKAEDAETGPLSVYGRTKLEGEHAARAEHPSALIVRTTPVGFAPRGDQLVSWILRRLQAGEEVPGFVDAIFSPIDTDALGVWILRMVAIGAQGVFHVAGGSHVSKYAFAQELARAVGLDAARVVEARVADASFAAPRGADMSLDSRRAAALTGVSAPDVVDVAQALTAQLRTGRLGEVAGMLAAAVTREGLTT